MIRKATKEDIPAISKIYSEIHTAEESGKTFVGWIRGVYPTENTARAAVERGDMFVEEDDSGDVIGTAIINQIQVDVYEGAPWNFPAPNEEVMVLHTLAISRGVAGKGFGKKFVKFYEQYALENGCRYLRMDTNETNAAARSMYKKLGYAEIGIVHCEFNGIKGVHLVLLEKKL